MGDTHQNRLRILLDIWLARLGALFAWVWLAFWALMAVVGLIVSLEEGRPGNSSDFPMIVFCLVLAAGNYLLLRTARRTKKLIGNFRLFCAVFAREPDRSIPDLARTLNLPADTVYRQLQDMCRRRYFNGYIDHQRQCMVFNTADQKQQSLYVVYCPGCGARTAVSGAGGVCRYCDAPLHPGADA